MRGEREGRVESGELREIRLILFISNFYYRACRSM